MTKETITEIIKFEISKSKDGLVVITDALATDIIEKINEHDNLINHINQIETNDMDNDEKWETLISILEGDY